MKLLGGVLLLSLAASCGNDPASGVDAPVNPGDDMQIVDAEIPAGYEPLIMRTWTLTGAQRDNYQCRRIMIDRDMWISGFKAVAPVGTHHTVLTVSENSTQVGDYPCSASSLDTKMLYASGTAEEVMNFPDGYAVHLRAGQYINLNLHLYNGSDVAIGGETGVLVKTVDASTQPKEVGFMFGGTTSLSIPPDSVDHTVSGQCQTQNWKLFALWPHMHQAATHQKVELIQGGNTTVLHDEPFTFTDQKFYPMGELQLTAGNTLRFTCTYNNNPTSNPDGGTITFGDSSNMEMCFTGLYTYPPPANLFQCSGF